MRPSFFSHFSQLAPATNRLIRKTSFNGAIVTIYRLYSQNGNRAGFWVQHRTWSNICGQVQSIAGHAQGALPGAAPLHDNASVLMRFFDVRSGRPIVVGPTTQNPSDKKFSQIAQPSWYSNLDLSTPETALAGDGDDLA